MDSDDANEITQKTFIKAYQKINTLDEPGKFSPWLYRLANNLCIDELRVTGRKRVDTIADWSDHKSDIHHLSLLFRRFPEGNSFISHFI